jgi:GcrA cell cycle regulator
MAWTDDRVTTLKKLYLDGLSASEIAKQLGGFPDSPDGGRNAVIGKIHRLGLNGRAEPSVPARPVFKAPRPVTPAAPRRVVAAEELVPVSGMPDPVPRIEEPGSATTLTLGSHMCRWPIGDPASDDFTFCGRRSGNTGPYCREHTKVAYKASSKRGPRKPHHDTNHVNF